ncbi:MAG: EamA family transporter [Gemmatimonadetes bacterium]|nr:EamA family transporter [Gemmatimonadota bacterium]MCA9762222.1 EamA family transporter [Gemmatimonadota bacterium]MCA9767268.1 EamA family transporter [Gemmatimonadota bacterium]MCB9518058.1 EamA family transporter [Gemmatimonadales bacterium]HRX19026.1 EamA family transporter [Gemmatimonadales bacterium]
MAPLIYLAFGAIYFIWGSTYLGIKFAGETLPPFLLAGARFVVAGALLMAWGRLRAEAWPTRREWLGSAGVGTCLIVLSNAPIVWVERHVDSGMVALFTAVSPLLIALFNRRRNGTPIGRRRWGGMALGTAGLAILASATLRSVPDVWPLVVIFLAITSWAFGSTFGRDWPQPATVAMASGTQMMAGGLLALAIGVAQGELVGFDPAAVSTRSLLAWVYLTVFGSMVAYTCYQWLLANVEANRVATSNYVNPVVAVALGVFLGGEALSPRLGVAAMLLVPAVYLVVTAPIGSGLGGATRAVDEKQ